MLAWGSYSAPSPGSYPRQTGSLRRVAVGRAGHWGSARPLNRGSFPRFGLVLQIADTLRHPTLLGLGLQRAQLR